MHGCLMSDARSNAVIVLAERTYADPWPCMVRLRAACVSGDVAVVRRQPRTRSVSLASNSSSTARHMHDAVSHAVHIRARRRGARTRHLTPRPWRSIAVKALCRQVCQGQSERAGSTAPTHACSWIYRCVCFMACGMACCHGRRAADLCIMRSPGTNVHVDATGVLGHARPGCRHDAPAVRASSAAWPIHGARSLRCGVVTARASHHMFVLAQTGSTSAATPGQTVATAHWKASIAIRRGSTGVALAVIVSSQQTGLLSTSALVVVASSTFALVVVVVVVSSTSLVVMVYRAQLRRAAESWQYREDR